MIVKKGRARIDLVCRDSTGRSCLTLALLKVECFVLEFFKALFLTSNDAFCILNIGKIMIGFSVLSLIY